MLIIDSDDYKKSRIEVMTFPGGEPHAKLPVFKQNDDVLLYLKLRSWLDVGYAACIIDAMEIQGVNFEIFMPYYPGARQDRSDGTSPFTTILMKELLMLFMKDCIIFDGHSNVCISYVTHNMMPDSLDLKLPKTVGVIAPDKGATDRAKLFRDKFCPDAQLVQGAKVRNPNTGELSNYTLDPLVKKGRYIIVDDICDGGGTFNLLVNAFDQDPIGPVCKLEMFVSHGIFSRGLDAISKRIEHITTTDSWCKPTAVHSYVSRLSVIPLLPEFLKFKEKKYVV